MSWNSQDVFAGEDRDVWRVKTFALPDKLSSMQSIGQNHPHTQTQTIFFHRAFFQALAVLFIEGASPLTHAGIPPLP